MTRHAKRNTVVQPAKNKSPVHCFLTERSHEVITRFADEHGVSLTSLIEAMCVALDERIEKDGMDCDPDWVKAARRIDAFRRKRS